jgi:tetratricopeptide (TPR) repeat protein
MGTYCSKKGELKQHTTTQGDYRHREETNLQAFQLKLLDESSQSDQAEINKVFGFYEVMVQREPENADWLAKMGHCLYAKERIDEAEGYFRKAVALMKDGDGKIDYILGEIAQGKGEVEEAKEWYKKAVAKDSKSAKVYVKLGELSIEEKDYGTALGWFQKGCELDAADAEARSGLGACLLYMGKVPEAIKQLQAAISLNPVFAKAHNNLANAYRQQGLLPGAIKHYILAIENSPKRTLSTGNFPSAHLNLAAAYFDAEDVAAALRHFEEAMHGGSNIHKVMVAKGYHLLFKHPRIRDGIELYLRQRYVAARDTLAEVRLQDKKNMIVTYYLAICCWKLREEDAAVALFAQVIKLGQLQVNAERHFLRGFTRRAEKQLAAIEGNIDEEENEASSVLNYSEIMSESPQSGRVLSTALV